MLLTLPFSRSFFLWFTVAALLVAIVVVVAVYTKRQGYFDPPLVRFARAMSANDDTSVEFARTLLADRETAWAIPWFKDEIGWQFEPGELPDAIVIVHAMSVRGLPYLADFDWKEGGEYVADAFEDMLDYYGLPRPEASARQVILAEAEKYGAQYSQIPILIAQYDAYFRQYGYTLAHLNTGSDAYQFVALSPATARCWLGVTLKAEPGRSYTDAVNIEEAIFQSGDYVEKHMPQLGHLISEEVRAAPIPASACLPWRAIWFNNSSL